MDEKEAEFFAKLLATFKIEAEEHLKHLCEGLLTLEGQLSDEKQKEMLEYVFREAHSLKGAARAVNITSIEKICQALEGVLAAYKKNQITLSRPSFDILYAVFDVIGNMLHQDILNAPESPLLNDLAAKLSLIEHGHMPPSQKSPMSPSPSVVPPVAPKASEVIKVPEAIKPPETVKDSTTQSEGTFEGEKDKTVRISSRKLDRLLQQIEEMLLIKLMTNQSYLDFLELQNHFESWEKEWIKVQPLMQSLDLSSKEYTSSKQLMHFFVEHQDFFNFLHESLHKRTKNARNTNRVIGGMIDGLLEDTKKLLMQPFSTLLDLFPRMVRDLSHKLEKDVVLELQGGEIELDRRILEELKDPLIHLIRNSLDHGIEKAEERQAINKSPKGRISIAASPISGSHVQILVNDDGQGMDIEKIKKSALKQKVITDKQIQELNENDLLLLIFQSGISTTLQVTELSGRGLGLGIVLEKVEKLGGIVSIETHKHQGTTFKIILPLTLSTFRGIHIKVADQEFILPTKSLKRILRIKPHEVKTLENKETILFEGHHLSFISLENLLDLSPAIQPSVHPYLLVLIVKAGETTIAIGVDEVLNEKEVLVKGLGKQLTGLKNIAGATFTEWGKIIPILDPYDLIKSAVKSSTRKLETQISHKKPKDLQKKILIAEDSITSRILFTNILETAGYQVKAAGDGVEAFSILMSEPIDLLLSDVEMPHMTGFELTEKVRATDTMKDIPIVLCTTRETKEDHERGFEVGANAYVNKSTFSHGNLLDIIQKLL